MFRKISKIMFLGGKSYLIFIFFATLLSIFSYMLGSNIILSVHEYLKSQIKPLLGGDIVLYADQDIVDEGFRKLYKKDFRISETIETTTSIFDTEKNSNLVELVYHDDNYPIYQTFSYDIINSKGNIIVSKDIFEKFGESIEILGKMYQVQGLIREAPLGNMSFFSNFEKIYIPLEFFDQSLSAANSQLDYKTYLQFRYGYDASTSESFKSVFHRSELRVKTLDDRNETIGDITDKFYLFINIFNLIIFVLTFFVVILSLETFYKKLKNTIGILSILGLKKTKIFLYSMIILSSIFLVSFLLASILNIIVIHFLQEQYSFFQVFPQSYIKSILITLILLFIGIYSPFYKVYTSDIAGLLSDNSPFSHFQVRDYFLYLLLIGLGFLGMSYTSGVSFGYSIFSSFVFIIVIVITYIIFGFLLKRLFLFFSPFLRKNKDFYSYDALRSTIRPGNVSFLIIFSSFLSFFSIFIFSVLGWSFISFLANLTTHSNDTFIINISKNYTSITRDFFEADEIYEIVPLRIKSINTIALSEHLKVDEVSPEFSREFSSLVRSLDELVVTGKNLSSGGVSVDEEFAKRLEIQIGDTLILSSAGLEKTLRVQNLRKAERNGANPFFYFSLFPSDFERFPKNYFVSYDSRSKSPDIQFQYSQATNGSVSFIDTKEIIDIILDVAKKLLTIIYFCLVYIFIFSFLTFIVSVSFLRTFKTHKLRLLHILGGQKKSLLSGVFLEYSYLVSLGLLFSILLGTILFLMSSYFINLFTLELEAYLYTLLFLCILFLMMLLYLKFSKNSI